MLPAGFKLLSLLTTSGLRSREIRCTGLTWAHLNKHFWALRCLLYETWSHHTAQAGLELTMLSLQNVMTLHYVEQKLTKQRMGRAGKQVLTLYTQALMVKWSAH